MSTIISSSNHTHFTFGTSFFPPQLAHNRFLSFSVCTLHRIRKPPILYLFALTLNILIAFQSWCVLRFSLNFVEVIDVSWINHPVALITSMQNQLLNMELADSYWFFIACMCTKIWWPINTLIEKLTDYFSWRQKSLSTKKILSSLESLLLK